MKTNLRTVAFWLGTLALVLSVEGSNASNATVGSNTTNATTVETALQGAGVYAKVLGNSGKVKIGTTEDPSSDPDAVTITMDGMYERDAAGAAVGTSGAVKHSFNSFASQQFQFGNIYTTTVGTATASALDFTASLVRNASLTVTLFMINAAGVITVNGNESFALGLGTLKFNVKVVGWPFCSADGAGESACSKGNTVEVGEFLDLDISIKGSGSATKVEGGVDKYGLGGGVGIDLSHAVMADDAWGNMPLGFPKVEAQGSSQVFTFRFPRFNASATYDPVLDGFASGGTTSVVSAVGQLVPNIVLVLMACVTLSAFQ